MFCAKRCMVAVINTSGVYKRPTSKVPMFLQYTENCNFLYKSSNVIPVLISKMHPFSTGSGDKNVDSIKKVYEKPIEPTRAQKLKKAVAEYGATVIVFHVGISLISLGSCYLLVSTGLDVNQLLMKMGINEWSKGNTALVSSASTFAVAYAIHKVFAPVRISITLASVPFIVRYLRLKGFLKK